MRRIVKNTLILFLITVISGIALGAVHAVTKIPIEKTQYQITQNSYKAVFSSASSFKDLPGFDSDEATAKVLEGGYPDDSINNCVQACDKAGNLLGYVVTVTTHKGYSGDITFSMGVKTDGSMNGYSVTSINETPGLGMKAKEPEFASQFNNKKVDFFDVTKTGSTSDDEIDSITGATITSKAITYGVDAGLVYARYLIDLTGGKLLNE